jgi:hypothetical protein
MKILRCECDMCDLTPDECSCYKTTERLPSEDGGQGLCPKLKDGTDPHTYMDLPEVD